MNSLVSSPLMFFVRCSYALSVFTGHKSGRFGHGGKKKLCMVFPCLDCLASPVGVNSTPSALKDLVLRSSIDRSADLDGRVRTSSMAAFQVKSFCDRSLLLFSLVTLSIYLATVIITHTFGNGHHT